MGIFDFNIAFINKFLNNFKGLFSKTQFNVFSLAVYSLFKEYSRNCLSRMAVKTNHDYQAFQYFFSDARWDCDALNTKRLKILENQRTTASTSSGVLVIDDTASPKPYAGATEGAKYQHCPPLKREEVCNVAVMSCFSSGAKYFPINLKFYKPESEFKYGKYDDGFRSKIDLARELIQDAMDKRIKFKSVVIDSWYTSNNLLEFVSDHGLTFVADVKPNRLLYFYHPAERRHCWVQQDELVKLIRSYYRHKLKPVKVALANGYERSFFGYSFKSNLKDSPLKIKVVVLFGDFCDEDSKSVRMLCLVAWSLVYWVRQNGCLVKTIDAKLSSFNDYKRAIDSLLILSSSAAISKNGSFIFALYGVKSQRFKNKIRIAA